MYKAEIVATVKSYIGNIFVGEKEDTVAVEAVVHDISMGVSTMSFRITLTYKGDVYRTLLLESPFDISKPLDAQIDSIVLGCDQFKSISKS
jgi:hypothetical protein